MKKSINNIEKLILEQNPNGVKYLELKELEDSGLIKLGRGSVISKVDISKVPGDYPVYSSSAVGEGEIGRYGKYMFEDERISWSIDGGGRFFYRPASKYSITNVSGWLKVLGENQVSTKYLFYVLSNEWVSKVFDYTHKAHPSVIRNEYIIPIPSIEIQEEIVKILNTFSELEAELETELQARQIQYEYYRDELLRFEDSEDIKQVRFGDIAKIVRGGSPRPIKNYITNDENGVNWIKIGDTKSGGKYINKTAQKIKPTGVAKSRFVKKGDFVLSNSMSFGRPYILKIDGCIHDGWLAISDFDQTYLSDYLYHLLSSSIVFREMAQKAPNGAVKNLNAEIVKSLILPAPSLTKQKLVVRLLDKFDALTNDISVGLPAELSARRSQYEYYRNKLLSFKEYAN
jgi:type I restriction enzyme, S subunit